MLLDEYLLGEEGGQCSVVGSGVLLFYRWDIVGEKKERLRQIF